MPAAQKDAIIQLRATKQHRDKIDRAARHLGATRSDFMLRTCLERADDVLPDRTSFTLSEAEWRKFTTALDKPPRPNLRLRRLLETKAPWDR